MTERLPMEAIQDGFEGAAIKSQNGLDAKQSSVNVDGRR